MLLITATINNKNMNIKTIFASLLVATMAMPSYGQTITDRFDFGYTRDAALSTPKEFSYDGKPYLMMYDGNDINTIQIYDDNLEVAKRITMKESLPFNYQLTYQDQVREVVAVNEVEKSEYCRFDSYEEFLEREMTADPTFDESCFITEVLGDGTKKIKVDYSRCGYTTNEQMYYNYSYFGLKYPKLYFIDNGKNFIGYRISYTVQYSDWKNAGTRVVDATEDQKRIRLLNINLNNGDGKTTNYFEVRQTLFNNDPSYEYIMPKYKLSKISNIADSNGSIGGVYEKEEIITTNSKVISEEKEIALAGFQILSEDGTIISDITFDSGFEGSLYFNPAFVITIGDNVYLAFDGYYNNTSSTIFYKIDKGIADKIQKVKIAPSSMRISPTVAKSSSTINVTFNDANEKGSDIVVVSASGAAMGSFHVPAGQTSAQIKTNASAGMYCVSRLQKDKVKETKKIIVK